eukprot:gene6603-8172_t
MLPSVLYNRFNSKLKTIRECFNVDEDRNGIGLPFEPDQYLNHCISKDLVITFPMSEEQMEGQKIQRSRIYPLSDTADLSSRGLIDTDKLNKNIDSVYPNIGMDHGFLGPLFRSISKSPYNQLSMIIASSNGAISNPYVYPFAEFLKRDRSTKMFQSFRKKLLNCCSVETQLCVASRVPDYDYIRFQWIKIYTPTPNFSYYCDLAKFNPDGSDSRVIFHTMSIRVDDHNQFLFLSMTGTLFPKSIRNEVIKQCDKNEAVKLFKSKYFELMGEEFSPNSDKTIHPTDSRWGYIQDNQPIVAHSLPSLKDICFTVLKEMYLINRESVVNKLLSLPIVVLTDFVESCYQDGDQPVAFEVIQSLCQSIENHPTLSQSKQRIFPINKYLDLLAKRDKWFLFSQYTKSPQSILHPKYNDQLLINVYDNYHRFIMTEYPDKERTLFQNPYGEMFDWSRIGKQSIVDRETFLHNLKHYSGMKSEFVENLDWSNLVIAGGTMTKCLTTNFPDTPVKMKEQIEKAYQYSDIDIYFYGISSGEDLEMKIMELVYQITGGEENENIFSACMDNSQLVISLHYPYRHIQIHYQIYDSIQDILLGTDVDSSCFAFDGTNVWTLEKGVHSLNYRMNFATENGVSIRGDPTYQRRLLKYVPRGFGIAYLVAPNFESIIQKSQNIVHSVYQQGVGLLYSASKDNQIKNILNYKTTKTSLPYGKDIGKKKFDNYIKSNSVYMDYDYDASTLFYLDFVEIRNNLIRYMEDVDENLFSDITPWDTFLDESRLNDRLLAGADNHYEEAMNINFNE